jgi:hypothetical protein
VDASVYLSVHPLPGARWAAACSRVSVRPSAARRSPEAQPAALEEAAARASTLREPLASALLPFQREGVRFGLLRGGRVLIADEMGVGKTLQALALAACYQVGTSVCPPVRSVCLSATRWARLSVRPSVCPPVCSGPAFPPACPAICIPQAAGGACCLTCWAAPWTLRPAKRTNCILFCVPNRTNCIPFCALDPTPGQKDQLYPILRAK